MEMQYPGIMYCFISSILFVYCCSPALKCVYLLELHPSLCLASEVYRTLEQARTELCELQGVRTASQRAKLEHRILKQALYHWHIMAVPGASYSLQIQKDVCLITQYNIVHYQLSVWTRLLTEEISMFSTY